MSARTLFQTILTAGATAALVLSPLAAMAGTDPQNDHAHVPLSSSDERIARDFFDMFGVDRPTQNHLLASYRAGDRWESMTSSSTPVSVDQQVNEGVAWTVSKFSDGSVRAEGIGSDAASLSEQVTPRGVDGCNYSVGKFGNFTNCHIYAWVGVVQIGFYANFSIVSVGYDRITSVWGGTLFAGGACSQTVPSPSIIKATESSTGKAVAGLTAQATMCVGGFTANFPTYLHVGANRADHVYS